MPAAEVMDRVSVEELFDWQEFYATEHSEEETRHALLLLKLDQVHWTKGKRKPSLKAYLRPLKKPKRSSILDVRKAFDAALGFPT